MMNAANEHRNQERSLKQKRETIRDSVKATMPTSSEVRRFTSEGRYGGRPLSRHGKQPSSSTSLDKDQTVRAHEIATSSQRKHLLYQNPKQGGAHHIHGQSSDEGFSFEKAQFVPRPPSGQRRGRPISAKGRLRPSSFSGSENIGSKESSPQIPLRPPLKLQSSFSKYSPLPDIGTGPQPDSDNNHVSCDSLVKGPNMPSNNKMDNSDLLLQTTAGLSTQHTSFTLPSEPSKEEAARIHLAVKLLNGSRHERWFRNSDTLGAVMAFAASLSTGKLPPCQFCTNEVPRRVFDNCTLSLSQAGIQSRTLLHLEEKLD
ncbi:PREDICTED: uncharacterized protein LOC107337716 [Acropora digitifera]|uniref:uncharacterized protein LOC107337716 n=1 Tax=Acropora digitifera TaxID=70779 RepID=UPI00077ACB92|nr:PREDICTED: uncharacterized protein LOC107337716 [Acropora digitifera]